MNKLWPLRGGSRVGLTYHIPVILAGGLMPENVAEAVRVVKPWGVDSFTHTNIPGTKRKDPERVKAFVEAAKAALNNTDFKGRTLRVDEARPSKSRSRRDYRR